MGYMRVLNLNQAVMERIGDREKIFAALRNVIHCYFFLICNASALGLIDLVSL
jgi:hypothetical protein